MLSLDYNLIFTIINIIVLYFLLKKFLFGPVCKMMDEREALIQKNIDDAESSKAEAAKLKESYEAEIAGAHEESVAIVEKAKRRAEAESENILQNAREESAKIISAAEATAQQEKAKALDDARFEIADLALLAASKVLAKKVDGSEDRAMAESFVSEVGKSE